MKNILKSTVALPFKFLKGIMEMMKAILNTILKLFGHPGLATGGEHSARVEKPEDVIEKDEVNGKNDLVNKPSIEQAHKVISDQSLQTIKTYISSKDRNPADIAMLSKTMKIYLSGLTPNKIATLSRMNDDQMKVQISHDLTILKQRQRQMMKHEPANKSPEAADDANNDKEKMSALKKRIQQRKAKPSPAPKMSFAM